MFLYDTHVHSQECSACAHSTAREMVRAYKSAGFSGFVLTNHFYHGNTAIDRGLEWKEFVGHYYNAYLEAADEGAKLDFDVMFGFEEYIGRSKEFLVYNLSYELLCDMPELRTADRETMIDMIHQAGGFIVHAHPFRFRDYMSSNLPPVFDGCDGIEVYNYANTEEENELARQAAEELGLVMTASMDNHIKELIPDCGMAFSHRVKTSGDLVRAFKSADTKLFIHGICR